MAKRCQNCGRNVVGHPNKKFCNSTCKDRYHNRTNPRGWGKLECLVYMDKFEDDLVIGMPEHNQWED